MKLAPQTLQTIVLVPTGLRMASLFHVQTSPQNLCKSARDLEVRDTVSKGCQQPQLHKLCDGKERGMSTTTYMRMGFRSQYVGIFDWQAKRFISGFLFAATSRAAFQMGWAPFLGRASGSVLGPQIFCVSEAALYSH